MKLPPDTLERTKARRLARFAWVGLLPVAVVAGLILAAQPPSEPVFEGVRLSRWIIETNDRYFGNRTPNLRAEAAVRAIGTIALPVMLAWLKMEDTPFKEKLMDLAEGQSWSKWRMLTPASAWHERARQGFVVLGPIASPAVPDLSRMLAKPDTMTNAADALFSIGPQGWEQLAQALTNREPTLRVTVAFVLEQSNFTNVSVPVIEHCMTDSEPQVREFASALFARARPLAGIETAQVVAFLTAELQSTNHYGAWEAMLALEKYGAQSKPAVPSLQQMLTNSDASFRKEAATALIKIDPETARAAGIK